MTDKKTEALKLALEGAANYIDALGGDSRKYRQALAEHSTNRPTSRLDDYPKEQVAAAKKDVLSAVERHGLAEQPAQQREPHGWYIDGYGAVLGASEPKSVRPGEWLPFYTSPPANKPLSGYINAAGINANDSPHIVVEKLERVIEAKLKEKNE